MSRTCNKNWGKDRDYTNKELKMIEYTVRAYKDGVRKWYLDGNLHCEHGPAIECSSGYKKWFFKGKLHRIDGPAVEYFDGVKEWYLNDEKLTEEEFLKRTQSVKELTIKEISELLGYEVKIVKG